MKELLIWSYLLSYIINTIYAFVEKKTSKMIRKDQLWWAGRGWEKDSLTVIKGKVAELFFNFGKCKSLFQGRPGTEYTWKETRALLELSTHCRLLCRRHHPKVPLFFTPPLSNLMSNLYICFDRPYYINTIKIWCIGINNMMKFIR